MATTRVNDLVKARTGGPGFWSGAPAWMRDLRVVEHRRSGLRQGMFPGPPFSRTPQAAGPASRRYAASARPTERLRAAARVTPENHASEIRRERHRRDCRNLERLPLYPGGTVFPPETRWEKWARAKHMQESSRAAQTTPSTWRCARSTPAWTSDTPPRRRSTRRRAQVGAAAQRADHAARPCTAVAGETVRMDKSSPSAPRATRRSRTGTTTGAGRARRTPWGGVRQGRRASRAVWARLWDDATARSTACSVHPRTAVLRLPPADRREPGGPDGQHRGERLTGERYRGHVFWDTEIFMLPFFILTQPDTAKALLRYRHHTLDGARANAREYGTGGARYAWESADTGREEPPVDCGRCQPDLDGGGGDPRLGRRRLRDRPVRRGDRRPGVDARRRGRDPLRDQPVLGRPGGAAADGDGTRSGRWWARTSSTRTSTTTRTPTTWPDGTYAGRPRVRRAADRHPQELAAADRPRPEERNGGRRSPTGSSAPARRRGDRAVRRVLRARRVPITGGTRTTCPTTRTATTTTTCGPPSCSSSPTW